MYALAQILAGLAIAHVAWLIFYIVGAMLVLPASGEPLEPGRATLRVVLASACGFAILGFESFVIGMLGLFSPLGLILIVIVNVALFLFLRRSGFVPPTFWRDRIAEVTCALRGPTAILYALMLILCTNAAYPDYQSDTLRVHLAYPYAWYLAGGIYVDHSFRFPYYEFNAELLYALMFMARVGRYIPFLGWLTGTIACLGTYGLIASVDEQAQRLRAPLERAAANAVYIFLPISVVFTPIFLRWTDTAMTDTLTGMLFVVGVAGVALSAIAGRTRYLLATALSFGFLAGIKPSFLFFVPLAAIVLFAACGRQHRRRGLLLAAALCILASPWYIKNFVQTGDPVPPIVHFALGQSDPDFTRADFALLLADIKPDRSIEAIERLPIREFLHPDTSAFREYGVTAVFLALYLIVIAAPLLAVKRGKSSSEVALAYVLGATTLGVAYLVATSVLARYSLLIYPTLAAGAGLLALYLARLVPRGVFVAAAIAVLCMIPSGTAMALNFYVNYNVVGYRAIGSILSNDRAALERNVAGYTEAEGIFDAPIFKSRAFPNVLEIGPGINYYFWLHGERPIGDWVGTGRVSDFVDAIDRGTAGAYLDAHRIGGLEIQVGMKALVPDEMLSLERQLASGGFTKASTSDASYAAYVRTPQ